MLTDGRTLCSVTRRSSYPNQWFDAAAVRPSTLTPLQA